MIASNDKIKIYSHEAQKMSADLSKSLEEITQKLQEHVFDVSDASPGKRTGSSSKKTHFMMSSKSRRKGTVSPVSSEGGGSVRLGSS